jgi:hypothetical protein
MNVHTHMVMVEKYGKVLAGRIKLVFILFYVYIYNFFLNFAYFFKFIVVHSLKRIITVHFSLSNMFAYMPGCRQFVALFLYASRLCDKINNEKNGEQMSWLIFFQTKYL